MDEICVESIKTKNASEDSPVILKAGVKSGYLVEIELDTYLAH